MLAYFDEKVKKNHTTNFDKRKRDQKNEVSLWALSLFKNKICQPEWLAYFSDILTFVRTIFLFHKRDIALQRYEINSLPKGISLCAAQYLYAVISLITSGINLIAECPYGHSAKCGLFKAISMCLKVLMLPNLSKQIL